MPRAIGWLLLLTGCIPELPVLEDPCAEFPDPGLYQLDIGDSDGRTRHPLVYVPAGAGPRDLVFMLHGAGQTPKDMNEVTGWNQLADREGFAVVYPAGVGWFGKVWNAGDNPYTDANDVGFLDKTADEATARLCGDRLLAVGFSNGGSMVHRWGCESDRPDAIVPAAGAYLVDDCPSPKPLRIYHGTRDTTAPYEGETRQGIVVMSVAELTALKVSQNECLPDPVASEGEGAEDCEVYECVDSLVVCTLDGWPHLYPGGDNTSGKAFDATAESWAWFDALPRDPVFEASTTP